MDRKMVRLINALLTIAAIMLCYLVYKNIGIGRPLTWIAIAIVAVGIVYNFYYYNKKLK